VKSNLRLAIPLIGGQLGSVLVMVSDNLMVGQLGITELAAISLGVAIFSIFFVVGYGISQGLPPLVSEAFGKADEENISKYLSNSLLINLGYALLVFLITELSIPFLYELGQAREVVDLAIPYLRLSVYSMIPFMLFLGFKSFSDGLGRTAIGMNALIVGNVLNVVLNYIFIFGKLGVEEMGVYGAGLSSLIARIAMLLFWLLLAFNSKRYRPYLDKMNIEQINGLPLKRLFILGGVTAIQMFFEVSLFSASTILMGQFGETPQAAHQVALNIITVSFMVTSSFAIAGTIEIGRHFGAKNWQHMRYAGFSAMSISVCFMALTGLFLYWTRFYLPEVYVKDQTTIILAAELLIFAAVFQVPDGLQVAAISALRGLQDVMWPAFYTFLAYIVFGLSVAYALAFGMEMGPKGIWIGLIIGLSTSAFLNLRRFWRLSRRN
jgi:MATE family multidrug resistance protein